MDRGSSVIVTELERELPSMVIEQQNGSRQFSDRDRARARATVGVKKKFPSPVRTTGRVIPFRSRLISVQLPFLSVFKPFPFYPTEQTCT